MKLFYLILAHKSLDQLAKLVAALNHKYAYFFIHIDKKISYNEIKKLSFYNYSNVVIIKQRLDIKWAGFKIITATLRLINAALKTKLRGYLILLSGQDFPIKPSEYIYRYLLKNYGREYIEGFKLPNPEWMLAGGIDRIKYHWFIDKLGFEVSWMLYEFQKKHYQPRAYFDDFPLFGGSQWWCITSECADFTIRFIKNNSQILEYFETTCFPDEIFFHTIIMNSPFLSAVSNKKIRFMDWPKFSAHPKFLTADDWDKIVSSNALWARKFDISLEAETVRRIENHIIYVHAY